MEGNEARKSQYRNKEEKVREGHKWVYKKGKKDEQKKGQK